MFRSTRADISDSSSHPNRISTPESSYAWAGEGTAGCSKRRHARVTWGRENGMTRYALIGAAGYIAPRHLQAIAATGGDLAAALDRSDSVGIMDRYFLDTAFFTEFERFEADLRRAGNGVDYVGICSPNYLHASHIRTALSNGAHAICEKPLVLEEADLDVLTEAEQASGRRVYTILQLRLHPAILELREKLAAAPEGTIH